jgi:hypothetical protein
MLRYMLDTNNTREFKRAAGLRLDGWSKWAYDRFQTVPKGTAHSPSPMEPASSPE